MADGKWIQGLTADTALVGAARRVLMKRLEVVRDHLPLALHEADKDPEYVHQLRVATRRAGAALEIFACCLSEKAFKQARKALRKIRRAAGAARDWDVFLITLADWQKHQKAKHRPGLDFLAGFAISQRQEAKTHLAGASPGSHFEFDLLLAETGSAVKEANLSPEITTLGDLAKPILAKLLLELDDAAGRNLDDLDHLHQVRILGKRLRYAMEIFADCFPPAFRDRHYLAVELMQEILGQANDSVVTCRLLESLGSNLQTHRPEIWKRLTTGFEGLLQFHQERMAKAREQFLDWWRGWHTSGEKEELAGLLRHIQVSACQDSAISL